MFVLQQFDIRYDASGISPHKRIYVSVSDLPASKRCQTLPSHTQQGRDTTAKYTHIR